MKTKSKFTKYLIYSIILVTVLLGCTPESRATVGVWASDLIVTMTNIEFLLVLIVGSFIGNSLSS